MKQVTIQLIFKNNYSELVIKEHKTNKEIKRWRVDSGNDYCLVMDKIHERYLVVKEK